MEVSQHISVQEGITSLRNPILSLALGILQTKSPTFILKTSPMTGPRSHHNGLRKKQHNSVLPGLYLTGKPQTRDAPKFLCWHTLNLTLKKILSEEKQAINLGDVSKGP